MSSSILAQLGINESFFVMLGIFLVLYIVNSFLSLKPLTELLVERDHRIDGREKEIKKIREEMHSITERLNADIKLAQSEASQKFSQLKSEAVESQRNILQHARQQASKDLNALKEKLQNDFHADVKKLEPQVDQFAQLIMDRFLATRSSAMGVQSQREV
jgi:F0F1-type ATP synthase membrane subunit b/b'